MSDSDPRLAPAAASTALEPATQMTDCPMTAALEAIGDRRRHGPRGRLYAPRRACLDAPMGEGRLDRDGSGEGAHAFVRRLFSCSDQVAGQILASARARRYAPRAAILRPGEGSGLAFLIMLGRAEAWLYSMDGQLILLCHYGPGDLFGDLGEAAEEGEEAEVRAAEAVQLLLFRNADFVRLAELHGCIGLALTRMLLRRLRSTARIVYERSALSAKGRVCAELLRQARAAPGFTVTPTPPVSRIAERASTTRETASRVLNDLERRGLVRRSDAGLTVVAPERLEEMLL